MLSAHLVHDGLFLKLSGQNKDCVKQQSVQLCAILILQRSITDERCGVLELFSVVLILQEQKPVLVHVTLGRRRIGYTI